MFSSKDHKKLKRLLSTPPKHQKGIKRLTAEDRSDQLAAKSRQRLSSARFRSVNEFLYSHSSSEAQKHVSRELFSSYHNTYSQLVKKWPKKPIESVIQRLKTFVKKDHVIADIGCGNEAQIKKAFPKQKVHSFDLISNCEDITAAEMTCLPLSRSSVDVCVYSLSLMATDLGSVLLEANRVLRLNGCLIISEVKSRFEPNQQLFVTQMSSLGFRLRHSEHVTDFFLLLDFEKVKDKKSAPQITLKSCVYKLR